MELATGAPITEYCDDHKLDTRARLELFAKVCRAVQHAHQKAIIHRDLKPSNILVVESEDEDGVMPKIIDFGIAKAIAQEPGEKTAFTAQGQLVGTPQYMSPEQAQIGGSAAADIDTRSDVYSLGVVLYELLAGSPPFDVETLRSAGFEGMCKIIREQDPPKPSNKLSTTTGRDSTKIAQSRDTQPHQLERQVRGELDWIVMRAIEKDRARRYESPNALAEDIARHLRDEPSLRRPTIRQLQVRQVRPAQQSKAPGRRPSHRRPHRRPARRRLGLARCRVARARAHCIRREPRHHPLGRGRTPVAAK